MKVVVFKATLQEEEEEDEGGHWYESNSLMKDSNYSSSEEDLSDCNSILFDERIIREPRYPSIPTPPNEMDDEWLPRRYHHLPLVLTYPYTFPPQTSPWAKITRPATANDPPEYHPHMPASSRRADPSAPSTSRGGHRGRQRGVVYATRSAAGRVPPTRLSRAAREQEDDRFKFQLNVTQTLGVVKNYVEYLIICGAFRQTPPDRYTVPSNYPDAILLNDTFCDIMQCFPNVRVVSLRHLQLSPRHYPVQICNSIHLAQFPRLSKVMLDEVSYSLSQRADLYLPPCFFFQNVTTITMKDADMYVIGSSMGNTPWSKAHVSIDPANIRSMNALSYVSALLSLELHNIRDLETVDSVRRTLRAVVKSLHHLSLDIALKRRGENLTAPSIPDINIYVDDCTLWMNLGLDQCRCLHSLHLCVRYPKAKLPEGSQTLSNAMYPGNVFRLPAIICGQVPQHLKAFRFVVRYDEDPTPTIKWERDLVRDHLQRILWNEMEQGLAQAQELQFLELVVVFKSKGRAGGWLQTCMQALPHILQQFSLERQRRSLPGKSHQYFG